MMQKLDQDFLNLFRRHIVFTADAKGIVLEVGPMSARHGHLAGLLAPGRELKELFDFNTLESLDDLPSGRGFIPGRPDANFFETLEEFHTTLSMVSLEVRKQGDNRFLCVLSLNDMLPNFHPGRNISIILTDYADSLLGFNQSFYSLFRDRFPQPDIMLRQPLHHLLSPGPAEIQAREVKRDDRTDPASFTPCYAKVFPGDNLAGSGVVLSGRSAFTPAGDGLLWENASDANAILSVPVMTPDPCPDLLIEADFVPLKGEGPQPLLGYGRRYHSEPDANGYIAGRHFAMDRSVIKKTGHIVMNGPWPALPREGRTISLLKSGRSLLFCVNGTRLCAYYDPHFPDQEEPAAALSLRPGESCLLRGLRVSARKTLPHRLNPDPVATLTVRLNTAAPRYAYLNRFANLAMTSSTQYLDVAGYLLQDITPLREEMTHLARQYERKAKESDSLRTLLKEKGMRPDPLVAESPAMLKLLEKARVIAGSRATALLQGETGTGKEVMAQYLHQNSPLREGPFVKVDCSTLPRDIMESELFGHEKGAFTGAVERKIGRFEQAAGGTLFLDEVGNLTPEAQKKLLQFLQDFTLVRLGGKRPVPLDTRVIAATNTPLQALTSQGLFREDLYYRLYVMVINLPPLRDRREDLAPLCAHFLDAFAQERSEGPLRLSPDAFKKLYGHAWPGNVRELKNVIRRAALFCRGGVIPEDLISFDEDREGAGRGPAAAPLPSQNGALPQALAGRPRSEIIAALCRHRGRIRNAARDLNATPRALYYYIKRKNIDISSFKKEE